MEAKFISHLVEETLEDQTTDQDTFDNVITGNYLPEINCYRFIIDEVTWDFPETWSFFSQIGTNVLPLEKWILAEFDKDNDSLSLIQCLKGTYAKMTFFVKSEQLYLELEKN